MHIQNLFLAITILMIPTTALTEDIASPPTTGNSKENEETNIDQSDVENDSLRNNSETVIITETPTDNSDQDEVQTTVKKDNAESKPLESSIVTPEKNTTKAKAEKTNEASLKGSATVTPKENKERTGLGGKVKDIFAWQLKIGGQAIGLFDFTDTESKPFGLTASEPANFGLHRASLTFKGLLFNLVSYRVHLLSMPMTSDRIVQIADMEIALKFHPLFNISGGRFKKAFTSQYTPYWGKWQFFDVGPAFKYVKGKMGLAGRGEGFAIKGQTKKKLFKYMLGVFNGLEEAKPWESKGQEFERSDKSVEIVARADVKLLKMLSFGAGGAVLPVSTLSVTTIPEDDTEPKTTTSKRTLWAYAFNSTFKHRGVFAEAEFIGHVESQLDADTTKGGGVNIDLLYDIPLPKGILQPGVRYAVFFPNFEATDQHTQSVIGAFNWKLQEFIKIGIEVGFLDQQPVDVRGTHGLLHLAVFH